MRKTLIVVATLLTLTFTAQAQSFSSGSTGADGALDLSTMNCPSGTCQVQLPESGILNYTTVNIPQGRTLVFKRNARNTPVVMLVQGDVTIAGAINVSASSDPDYPARYSTPGPGGFYGGAPGQDGLGPGGGQASPYHDGKWVGPLSLVPIIGGSGGAGVGGHGGGGGGGAIVIASSTSIVCSGSIFANGVFGDTTGSGGAIRLVANSINVSGGFSAYGCCGVGPGIVRLEAPTGALTFTGSSSPAAVLSPINPVIVSAAPPQLTIISIGGYPIPSYAGSRFDTVDLLLPNQLTDPINIVLRASNIPLGTQIDVKALNGSGSEVFTPGTLTGTFESSTATATASNLNRASVTFLIATATFNPPQGAAVFNPKGPDQVAKVRVEAAPGAKPKYIFLRGDGTMIEVAKVPKAFLQQFGQ